jgi:hypothetical protein
MEAISKLRPILSLMLSPVLLLAFIWSVAGFVYIVLPVAFVILAVVSFVLIFVLVALLKP